MDLEDLGRRIRRVREERGYSQEAFAHLVGKDQTAISEYENGRRRMFVSDIPIFARILQVPIAYFFEGDIHEDDLDRAMLDEFHKLPNETKPNVIEMIRLLTKFTTILQK